MQVGEAGPEVHAAGSSPDALRCASERAPQVDKPQFPLRLRHENTADLTGWLRSWGELQTKALSSFGGPTLDSQGLPPGPGGQCDGGPGNLGTKGDVGRMRRSLFRSPSGSEDPAPAQQTNDHSAGPNRAAGPGRLGPSHGQRVQGQGSGG